MFLMIWKLTCKIVPYVEQYKNIIISLRGSISPLTGSGYALKPITPLLMNVYPHPHHPPCRFCDLLYQWRFTLDNDELPSHVTDRPNCHWGARIPCARLHTELGSCLAHVHTQCWVRALHMYIHSVEFVPFVVSNSKSSTKYQWRSCQ